MKVGFFYKSPPNFLLEKVAKVDTDTKPRFFAWMQKMTCVLKPCRQILNHVIASESRRQKKNKIKKRSVFSDKKGRLAHPVPQRAIASTIDS